MTFFILFLGFLSSVHIRDSSRGQGWMERTEKYLSGIELKLRCLNGEDGSVIKTKVNGIGWGGRRNIYQELKLN